MNFCEKGLVGALTVLAVQGAFASGFSLYEASAESYALGGAVLGKAVDGSANFYNPATLNDFTNIVVTVGAITEHPRLRGKVNGNHSKRVDPGCYPLPHVSFAAPLPYDFAFGFGIMPEYGLGSHYSRNWEMAWNSTETTVQGIVFNPNISYGITDKWSVAAGLRWLFFDFEQYSSPQAASDGKLYGTTRNHLKGDNEFRDIGWQVATRYQLLDNLALGAIYKSKIDVHVYGHCSTHVTGYDFTVAEQTRALYEQKYAAYGAAVAKAAGAKAYSTAQKMIIDQVNAGAKAANGDADADLELPQSVAFGFNWDITDTVHFGAAASWTEWSTIDTLVFELPNGDKDIHLNWKDTWRFSVAPSWDFADDWTAMCSYTYDMDCTDSRQDSTMLPPADRHTLAFGLTWHCWKGLAISACYGILWMDGGTMTTKDSLGNSYSLEVHRGLSHAGGLSLTYAF